LWALLEDHASPGNLRPWPSRRRLAEFMGVSTRTVSKYLAELVASGWLEVEERSGTSNLYRTMWPVGPLKERAPVKGASRVVGKGASRGVLKGASTKEEPVEEEPVEEEPRIQSERETQEGAQLALVPSGGAQPQPDGFDDWWEVYPNSKGKQAARKSWARKTQAQRRQVVQALLNYRAALDTHRRNGGTPPTMHASTFLNGRWEDWLTDNTPDQSWPTPRGRAAVNAQGSTDEAKQLARQLARLDTRSAAR
jgi:DNA-binding transcriptional MocR family regulator